MSSSTKLTSGSVTLNSSTAALIVAARPGRKLLKIVAGSGVTIGDSSLNSSNGYPPNSGNPGMESFETQDALYGISSSGTPSVQFIELHD